MSGSISIGVDAWAYGPQGRDGVRDRLRPVGLVAGILGALGAAAVVGFVAFVMVAGSDDAAPPATGSPAAPGTDASALESLAAQPLLITDLRLTDAVDAATGEPASSIHTFGIGEPVHLWLSFEAGDANESLTAVWFRGESRIARLKAPLPDAASQMVFPLPQVAVDRPGSYRVEVRSHRDVLVAESFEVTHV